MARKGWLRRLLPAFLAGLALALVLTLDPGQRLGAPGEGGFLGSAVEANREVLTRAGASFAAAKAISATLSVVASAEVTGSIPLVGGVGGAVSPGSALTPVANLVDSFSTVMLTVASLAAATEVGIRAGGAWGLGLLLPAGLALLLASALLGLLPGGGPPRIRAACRRLGRWLAVLALVLNVLLPASILGAARLSAGLLEPQWRESTARLEVWEREATEETTPAEPQEDSLLDRLWRLRDAIGRNVERVDIAGLLQGFDDLFMELVTLITAFFMRALVLPLLLLWAMSKALRIVIGAFTAHPPEEPEAEVQSQPLPPPQTQPQIQPQP